jgi:hypothetical protein
MITYPVNEAELKSLSSSDAWAGFFAALGTFAAGSLISLWIGLTLAPLPLSPVDTFLQNYVVWILIALALLFFGIAGIFWLQRKTVLDEVRKSSYGEGQKSAYTTAVESKLSTSITAGSQK